MWCSYRCDIFSKRNELLKDDNTEKHRHEIAAISYHHGAITNAEPCECRKKAKQLYSGPASQEKNDAAVSAASAAEGTKLFEEDGAKSNTSNFGYSSNDDSGSSSSTGCGSPSLVMPSTSSTATMDTAASSSISSAGPVHNIAPGYIIYMACSVFFLYIFPCPVQQENLNTYSAATLFRIKFKLLYKNQREKRGKEKVKLYMVYCRRHHDFCRVNYAWNYINNSTLHMYILCSDFAN